MENLRHSRETVAPYESDTEFMNRIDASLWWYLYRRLCGLCSSSSNSLLIENVEKESKRGLVEEARKDGDGWQGKGAAKAEHAVFSRYAKNDTNLRARTNLCFLLSLSFSLTLSVSSTTHSLVFPRGWTAKHPSVEFDSKFSCRNLLLANRYMYERSRFMLISGSLRSV